jgi:hypothetical protein
MIPPPKEPTIADYVQDLLPYAFVIAILFLVLRPILGSLFPRLRGRKTEPDDAEPWKNEPKVTSLLLKSNESYSEIKRVNAASGEFLYDPFDKQRKDKNKEPIYTGLPARTVSMSGDILPTRVSRFIYAFLFPFGWRIRLYHQLYNEPCTRDLFTGNVLLPDKKNKTLIEKGVIDAEGFLLDREKNGQRFELEGCWIKPDFSDVDFIKSEFHAYKQSEVVVDTAKAMRKTGQEFDRWFFYVLLAAFAAFVIIVFIMSGVGP